MNNFYNLVLFNSAATSSNSGVSLIFLLPKVIVHKFNALGGLCLTREVRFGSEMIMPLSLDGMKVLAR